MKQQTARQAERLSEVHLTLYEKEQQIHLLWSEPVLYFGREKN